jgi:predicted RNA binding protein YcfA (HicA-like mRNA interferase family)
MQITSSKQRKTLEKIFTEPTPNDIPWTTIESLLEHVGCETKYGRGSKASFKKDSKIVFIHRPHPQRQTPIGTVKEIKIFLEKLGVTL